MSDNPLNATFFAFRKRERGGVLVQLTVAFVVLSVLLLGSFLALNVRLFGTLFSLFSEAMESGALEDGANAAPPAFPPELVGGIGMLMLTGLIFAVVYYIALAAYEAGCLKWMIRGEVDGPFGLSLGADTWRVYSTYWIWFLLNLGFSIVMGVIMLAALGIFAIGSGDITDPSNPARIFVELLQYVLMAYFGVRLAPAAATSITRRKFSFFQAWTVTRGRFWALFGAFFLVYVIFFALWAVIFGVGAVTMFAGFAAAIAEAGSNPDQAAAVIAAAMFRPENWVMLGVLYGIVLAVGMVFYVMMFGINARAAVAAVEDGKIEGLIPETAKTFD
jgi:hypothetical protein